MIMQFTLWQMTVLTLGGIACGYIVYEFARWLMPKRAWTRLILGCSAWIGVAVLFNRGILFFHN